MMPSVKVLKNPGFLCDLNYLFYSKFNAQLCVEGLPDETKKESYDKFLKDILNYFGDVSEDLYVFYHAISNGNCFVVTHYVDPYKNRFAVDFDFKFFKNLFSDRAQLIRNMIRFYLPNLSEDELEVCCSSISNLFSFIKESKYSGEEKSRLYEFFVDPDPYLQALQCELVEKEILLSNYYKENYETILEAYNNITYETLSETVQEVTDLSFLKEEERLFTSFCLLHKYYMNLYFTLDGTVYLLGCDYASIVSSAIKAKQSHPLEDLCGALSETSRVHILRLLVERQEVTCKDLERIFHFSGSTAYHHITLLVRIGAVKVRNEGKTIYYSLNRIFFDTMRTLLKVFSNE